MRNSRCVFFNVFFFELNADNEEVARVISAGPTRLNTPDVLHWTCVPFEALVMGAETGSNSKTKGNLSMHQKKNRK